MQAASFLLEPLQVLSPRPALILRQFTTYFPAQTLTDMMLVMFYAAASRSTPCQAWDTNTQVYLMLSGPLLSRRASKVCTRVLPPIWSRSPPQWQQTGWPLRHHETSSNPSLRRLQPCNYIHPTLEQFSFLRQDTVSIEKHLLGHISSWGQLCI